MRRTFVIRVEDKAGAFLKAARVIGSCGGNIVRTSYNRSVDSHTMFLEVAADKESVFERISEGLGWMGYLEDDEEDTILISIAIPDVPGAVVPVLEILSRYNVNISYMNAQDNGTPIQHFKMAIHIDDPSMTKAVLDGIAEHYEITILDYEMTDKVLDNTVFYMKFASDMKDILSLNESDSKEMMICSNRIMQILDDRGELPFKTFEYVRKFAEFVVKYSGEAFDPRYSCEDVGDLKLHTIEPPCGSTVYVLESDDSLLFVDGGFSCYADDTFKFIESKIPDLASKDREIFITHPDLDHVGLCPYFAKVRLSGTAYDDFLAEEEGRDRYRESNPNHAPYYRISAIIAQYKPFGIDWMDVIGRRKGDGIYENIGSFFFGGHEFVAFEGNGGHVDGDTILVCDDLGLVFTGDDLINVKGSTKEQREFNTLAPYLMQSVNMDSDRARQCRLYIESEYKGYLVCPGHGPPMRI